MQKNKTNPTFLLTLSAAFEYYDFIIYGMMVSYLGPLFFPSDNDFVSYLQAFAVFALGYVVRPLGGIIIGALGDLINRKNIFVISNLILALATVALSLLPNFSQIGISATFAIIILRVIQSFSFSAEMPGAMSILKDNNKDNDFCFIVSGAAIGAVLASSILYLLERSFTHQEILDFAWRIPFALGAILCFVSLIMRQKLPDSQHIKSENRRMWLKDIMLDYKKIIAYVLIIAISAYMIMMNLFFPTILPKFYGFEIKEVYLAITASLIWAIIYAPIFSYFTNKFNRLTLLQTIIIATISLAFIINSLLHNGYLIIALCIYQSMISSFMVIVFPLMAESFAAEARFTLIAACYNITYAIIAFVPNLVIEFASSWNSPFSIWLALIILCFFAAANMKILCADRTCTIA